MADKTWFDYFVSGVALVTGAYTVYKNFLEGPKFSILPGDRLAVVRGPGGARKLHLRCVLVNKGTKVGTLQRIEVNLIGPDRDAQRFVWNELLRFVPGTTNIESAGLPLPVAVAGKSSSLLLAQVELTEPGVPARWTTGQYKVEVLGWVDREDRRKSANVSCVFHINVPQSAAAALPTPQKDHGFVDFPIEEWSA